MFGIATPKRPRPESESEEEGPYRPRRRGKGEVSLGSQSERDELITGVDASDLPIVADNPNEAQKRYQKLAAIRILDWQIDGDGQPIRKPLRDSTALTAALIQTRAALKPLIRAASAKTTKALGECVSLNLAQMIPRSLPEHVQIVVGTPGAHKDDESIASSFISKDSLTDTTNSSVAEEVHKDEERAAPIQEDIQTNVQEHIKESDSQTPAPRSRLDGKVVPFPLGPETINDLPLLKQAIKDIVAHLNILHRRVQQLEEKRRSINPWELV
ncbi:hypothetical protein CNMCM5623_002628 [Aspergillus felis]|uniref:Uncharacterized protein n=1 Tax=Aspergillus felis TaxID=1287682 RepID=A0A8H6V120_9EURO|nr:hypothetical protein CNMCM5623_002628 [Aspergillus felis]